MTIRRGTPLCKFPCSQKAGVEDPITQTGNAVGKSMQTCAMKEGQVTSLDCHQKGCWQSQIVWPQLTVMKVLEEHMLRPQSLQLDLQFQQLLIVNLMAKTDHASDLYKRSTPATKSPFPIQLSILSILTVTETSILRKLNRIEMNQQYIIENTDLTA